MKWVTSKYSMVSVGVLLLLSGCGGNSGTNEEPMVGVETLTDLVELPGLAIYGLADRQAADIRNPWLATIRTFRTASNTPGSGDAYVSTLQYSAFRTVQEYIDFYSANVELDTCDITLDDSTGGSSTSSNAPYVSGGQEVVINAPNGTWFTIGQSDETGIYEVNNELPGAIPAGATLSIPGNEFPSVSAFPFSEPLAPVRLAPITAAITIEDEYRWEPVGGPGVYMQLTFLQYDSNGDFAGFLGGCDVVDDGEFELPLEALAAIEFNTNTLNVRYTRRDRSLNLHEGVVVYSRISVAE